MKTATKEYLSLFKLCKSEQTAPGLNEKEEE